MNIKESAVKIVNLIRSSEPIIFDSESGFMARFEINSKTLSSEEKGLLKDSITGVFEGELFFHYIADNDELPILFEEKKHAFSTLMEQGKHLEKRFLFGVFMNTSVMVEVPKEAVVNFIPRKSKAKK